MVWSRTKETSFSRGPVSIYSKATGQYNKTKSDKMLQRMRGKYRKDEVHQSKVCSRISVGAEITNSLTTGDHRRMLYTLKMMNILRRIGPIRYKWLISRNRDQEHLMQVDIKIMMEVPLLTCWIDRISRRMMIDLDQVFRRELERQTCINVELHQEVDHIQNKKFRQRQPRTFSWVLQHHQLQDQLQAGT